MRRYRTLGDLHSQFRSLYKNYMSVTQAISIFCVVVNMYQAVVLGSMRAFVLALVLALGLTQFLEVNAEVYHTSSEALRKWQCIDRRNVPLSFAKFLKSCKFLGIPVGSFFYVDRGLVLTVLSIMLNTSATLILTK